MNSNAELIKCSVPVEEVILRYTGQRIAHGRTQCPIHNGKDANFSIHGKMYKCFVCGASGDCISLVMELFGIGFVDAMTKLDADFDLRLGLSEKLTEAERKKRVLEAQQIARQREAEQRKAEEEKKAADAALERFAKTDRALFDQPETPEQITDDFVEALRNKDYNEYMLTIGG